jgi:hypothetical protein
MLNKLFGGGTIKAVGKIVDELYTSEDERNQAKLAIQKVEAELKKRQLDINLAEAKHRSIFVSGWRPCLGWVGSLSVAYVYLLQPILDMILQLFDIHIQWVVLDLGQLMPLILGMLGLGGLRSFEKSKGLTK